jgi:hypothetical protein
MPSAGEMRYRGASAKQVSVKGRYQGAETLSHRGARSGAIATVLKQRLGEHSYGSCGAKQVRALGSGAWVNSPESGYAVFPAEVHAH